MSWFAFLFSRFLLHFVTALLMYHGSHHLLPLWASLHFDHWLIFQYIIIFPPSIFKSVFPSPSVTLYDFVPCLLSSVPPCLLCSLCHTVSLLLFSFFFDQFSLVFLWWFSLIALVCSSVFSYFGISFALLKLILCSFTRLLWCFAFGSLFELLKPDTDALFSLVCVVTVAAKHLQLICPALPSGLDKNY